jgi:hypothetical protein
MDGTDAIGYPAPDVTGTPLEAKAQYCSTAAVGRGPFAVGIAAAEVCQGPCDGVTPIPGQDEPVQSVQLVNYARGMASDLTGIISYYRATYP